MAVKVLELHHHGIRVGSTPEQLSKALTFYRDVLGLTPDPRRPEIPDPTLTHVALAVPDVQEAKRELDRLGVKYWTLAGVVGPHIEQIFMDDPFGNMIELHQIGTCRCNRESAEGTETVD
jgi:catechol 2,3-dioxygenase-like lactoylglutathione lyase family enzyme